MQSAHSLLDGITADLFATQQPMHLLITFGSTASRPSEMYSLAFPAVGEPPANHVIASRYATYGRNTAARLAPSVHATPLPQLLCFKYPAARTKALTKHTLGLGLLRLSKRSAAAEERTDGTPQKVKEDVARRTIRALVMNTQDLPEGKASAGTYQPCYCDTQVH